MFDLEKWIQNYLDFCQFQKELNSKTIKAYKIDLKQFCSFIGSSDTPPSKVMLTSYITYLHKNFSPRSVKRKIASVKAFFSYLEYEEVIYENPFVKIKVKFQEPHVLPRTIPLDKIEKILLCAYNARNQTNLTKHQHRNALRDIAVLEMLFATGMRVSELCSIKNDDINISDGIVRIYGKGSKERIVQVGNNEVLSALSEYQNAFQSLIAQEDYFFINRLQHKLSEQSVRFMINKYTKLADIDMHITPHMFRHPYVKPTTKNFSTFLKFLCRGLFIRYLPYSYLRFAKISRFHVKSTSPSDTVWSRTPCWPRYSQY